MALPRLETAVLRLQDVLDHPQDPLLLTVTPPALPPWPADRPQLSGQVDIQELTYSFAPGVMDTLSRSISGGRTGAKL